MQKGPYGGAFKSPVPVKGEHMKSAVTSEIVNEINYSILDDPQGRLDLADRVVRLLRTSEEDFSLVKQTSWYRGIWRAFNGNTLERVGASCQRAVQAQALVVALLKSVLRIGPDAREILALIAGEIEHIRSTFGDSAFPDSGPAGQVIELSGQSTTAPGQEIYGADLPEQTMLLILRTMIACARMDGPLAQAEVDLISRTVEAPGFSEDARSSIRSELFDPQPFQFNADGLDQYPVRYLLYKGVAAIMLGSGVVRVKEKAFLEKLVRDLGIKRQDARRIEHELAPVESVAGLDALVAAVVKASARQGPHVTGEAAGDDRRDAARRRLAESWLTYMGTMAAVGRSLLQAPLIRRIKAYIGSINILAGLDLMNEAAIRDEVLSAAEAFCTLSSRNIDENLLEAFPSFGSASRGLWSEAAARQVSASVREELRECFRELSEVSNCRTRLRGLDPPTMECLNESVFQGIQVGGTLLDLGSGAISNPALYGSYGWIDRERSEDPAAVELYDTYSECLGRFYACFDEALDNIGNRLREIGVQYLEERLDPALDGLDLDIGLVWQFHAPSLAMEGHAAGLSPPVGGTSGSRDGVDPASTLGGTAGLSTSVPGKGGVGAPVVSSVCIQCGASAAEKVLWGRRFCDQCYDKNDFKAFVRMAVERSITGERVFTAPDIPPTKLKNARKRCQVPDDDATVALIDCTLFGSAHDCVLLTESGIYGRNLGGPAYFIPYHALHGASIIESVDDINCIWIGEKGLMNLKGSDVPRNEMLDLLQRIQKLIVEKWGSTGKG